MYPKWFDGRICRTSSWKNDLSLIYPHTFVHEACLDRWISPGFLVRVEIFVCQPQLQRDIQLEGIHLTRFPSSIGSVPRLPPAEVVSKHSEVDPTGRPEAFTEDTRNGKLTASFQTEENGGFWKARIFPISFPFGGKRTAYVSGANCWFLGSVHLVVNVSCLATGWKLWV